MAEKLRTEQKGFKVWKNPQDPRQPVHFVGEFYPPAGHFFLTGSDLRQLGCGAGRYTVLAPANVLRSDFLSKWQTVVIPE
jgi:hypothetical protein